MGQRGVTCTQCGHEMSQGLCWRLTCPSHGARESAQLVRDRVKRDCASAAQQLRRYHEFDDPPDKALAFVFDDEDEE